MKTPDKHQFIKNCSVRMRSLSFPFVSLLILSSILLCTCLNSFKKQKGFNTTNSDVYAINYDVSLLDDSAKSKLIKQGFDVFQNTSKHLGPNNGNNDKVYAGNNLSCNNCHLWSGTKPYAAPLIGIIQRFPQFRGRENKVGTIEERINGCMERSMNGKILPKGNSQMKSLIAYLNWLSRLAPEDGKIKGQGFVEIEIPNRAVDLEKGRIVFKTNCVLCHGENGQGKKSAADSPYKYPPLWGHDSYNDGAGMTRVITAAQFIKANMPYGTTYDKPVLTDEEAYDVAGYINQQMRPQKKNREVDFPDLKKKPVSTPYGPYVDSFPVQQHQLGPFQPIMKYYKEAYNMVKSK